MTQGDDIATPGDPFLNNFGQVYWSSTPRVVQQGIPPDSIWVVNVGDGTLDSYPPLVNNPNDPNSPVEPRAAVWPVCAWTVE